VGTTSFASFRDAQAVKVTALTPTSLGGVKFVEHRDEQDFRDWVVTNPQSCLRRYAIEDLFEPSLPEITNGDVWWWEGTEEVVIAYPDTGYGPQNARDRNDVMREDFYAIDTAIGARAGAYSSGHAVLSDVQQEPYEGVTLLVLTYTYRFWRGETPVAITGPSSSTANAIVLWNGTSGTIVKDSATLLTALAALATSNAWTANQYSTVSTLASSSGTTAVNAALSNTFYHNITENSQIANPSNLAAGMRFSILIEANGTHELTWGAYFDWGNTTAAAPDCSAQSDGDLCLVDCYVKSTTYIMAAASEWYTP